MTVVNLIYVIKLFVEVCLSVHYCPKGTYVVGCFDENTETKNMRWSSISMSACPFLCHEEQRESFLNLCPFSQDVLVRGLSSAGECLVNVGRSARKARTAVGVAGVCPLIAAPLFPDSSAKISAGSRTGTIEECVQNRLGDFALSCAPDDEKGRSFLRNTLQHASVGRIRSKGGKKYLMCIAKDPQTSGIILLIPEHVCSLDWDVPRPKGICSCHNCPDRPVV